MANIISKGVTLYTAGTPNGWKVSVLLKELKYPHTVRKIGLSGEQKEEWYLKINPNGRIPAIVDHDNGDLAVFESGACMMYLAEKAGKLLPQDMNKKYDVIQWLMFQMGGLGPMQGQANHFVRYAPEKIEYGMNRYVNETQRLYRVIERQLTGKEWLAADEYTIADIANFCWIVAAPWAGVETSKYPNLEAWVKKIHERQAVVEGLDVPDEFMMKKALADPKVMAQIIADAQSMMVSAKHE